MIAEINFDGIIGPSHNYAGLSAGNLASASNSGKIAHPRAAALQGLEKMRHNIRLGLAQGFFPPLDRPNLPWLASLSTNLSHAPRHLRAQATSASAMWAANAATVSPASDCRDGKCHFTVANLQTMPHRSHEWRGTLAILRAAFANEHFAVHGPIPAPFGDEGAANHMRLCEGHASAGVEIFVYGLSGGPFPARQHRDASEAVARAHGLNPAKTIFLQQSEAAITAGAFHNDVVAVANERVLFTHEEAFHDKSTAYAAIEAAFPAVQIIEVPASAVSLADAIKSYLFNAQLVSLPAGGMGLILPTEAQENDAVWQWLQNHVRGNGPITKLFPVNVRQSMANGGGPACLRLRVLADPRLVDARFMADEAALDRLAEVISGHWPETLSPDDVDRPALADQLRKARLKLLRAMDLADILA